MSEVPLGAFLSGGIDSSLVVGLMSSMTSQPVKTFSIGFKEDDFSELPYARQVAAQFGTEHHEFIVEPDVIDILPSLIWACDQPFADASIIPTYYVSKLAREHVTVALSGDGGDELFAGYDRYVVNLRRSRYAVPPWLGRMYRNHIYPLLPQNVRGRNFAWNISLPSRDRY